MAPHVRPFSRYASRDRILQEDVAAMILDRGADSATDLARDIITVVRERVLQEIGTYARQNIR